MTNATRTDSEKTTPATHVTVDDKRIKIPATATQWNGPLQCLWREYDANGVGRSCYQDSWGRAVAR